MTQRSALGRSRKLAAARCEGQLIRRGSAVRAGASRSAGVGGNRTLPTYLEAQIKSRVRHTLSQYSSIDSILSEWAIANSLHWYAEYQDTEVRKLSLHPERRDRVLISVDVPQGEQTVVRVGQNRRGLSRLSRLAEYPTPVTALSKALDRALRTAKAWLAEDDSSRS